MNVADVQEWQKVQEDFEKNWTDGTFPGWPVNVVFDIMITVFYRSFLNDHYHCTRDIVTTQLTENVCERML